MLAKHYCCWVFFFTLVLLCNGSVKISRRDKHGMLGAPPLSTTNSQIPPDSWFTQLLNHFEPTDTRTWKQRYQVVTDHYEAGGPVFLLIGGEGETNALWMIQGAWVDYAKKYNALLFQVEHRYYGKSHPTSDLSVENLKYLSSEQALADLAYFIVAMNNEHNLPSNTKWVAFGGSYPGNLAAWIRFKYPHLIHASMSASGPVLAKVDFSEYMDVVKSSLATHSTKCVKAVESANKHINILLKTPIGQDTISSKFRLCSPIDINNMNDVANLLEALAENFAGVVQYNKDNRMSDTAHITIDTLCDIMVNESLGTPVIRYAAVNSLLLETNYESCLDYTYENYLKEIKNTTWGATKGARQWTYQTCTEFGYFQSSESKTALFGEDFPVDFFIQQCADIFGKSFTKDLLDRAVYRSNAMYGGLDLQATRVVYVHGSIDPWHALGITKTRIPQSPAIYINGTAHCANMYPVADNDLPALTAARQQISALIGKWLQEP
ncbi:putative serine protease K12H4.7 [Macrosteles quadrilineatus]|uniref:putative serine protease K12H4.7 n=1 Tax=Macrosteles quadrilineatus TaxID=74068 RepID=UPI0023E24275|nr:putative serine protease K12H4.7 [Macrosteles quadrilineatus]XP_054258620.1 putative serine protease K12H4.7 [Macrosteles quadrilineatus]XP_054258621.1 putative serine protease K12H4.7 [Macrosteles quadrilineatus]XP_054258622.1 putative serine protease K12H4.7 [Macrosteles quadrilineatus]